MASTQISEIRSDISNAIMHSSSAEAGWQRQGKLWSNLKELCDLLRIPAAPSINDEEFLFQHVQFKTGQRIHTIGQTFDTLYIVNSGFLKTVLIDEFGNEQVLSFPMKGDMLGVDGIHRVGLDVDAAAVTCRDDRPAGRQTLPAAPADLLRGEEGVEQLRQRGRPGRALQGLQQVQKILH